MTTLFHLNQTVIDMQQELAREQRFGNDSRQGLLKGISLLREALDSLERDINTCFDERDRAIGRVLGNTSAAMPVTDGPVGSYSSPFGSVTAIGANGAAGPYERVA